MQSSTSTSSPSGCGIFIAFVLVAGVVVAFINALAEGAKESPVATNIIAALTLTLGVATIVLLQRRKTAKARALQQAAIAEQQRQYALQQEAQQRQLAEQERQRHERWAYLCGRYGEENARRIWDGHIWVGCTVDMMLEILGQPLAMDERVLKTKTKHTYKYRPTGTNRYALRVFVENNQVTGWEDKTDD